MSESGAGTSEPTGAEAPEPEVPDGTEADFTGFVAAGPITGADGTEDGGSGVESLDAAGAADDGAVADGQPDTRGTTLDTATPLDNATHDGTEGDGPSGTEPPDAAGTPDDGALPDGSVAGVPDDTATPLGAATPDDNAAHDGTATPVDVPAPDHAATPEDARSEAQSPEGAAVGEAPDLTEDVDLDAALEALLLVVDVPAGEELLADTLDQPVARIRSALERLAEGYTQARRGLDLRRVGDGWRFYTRETYAPYVERYLLDGQRAKLTRAALETLAVVAYRQPVSRARVAAVRGVNVDGVIRTLVGRGLVEEAGTDPSTGGILYCTTELFLERLGLSSLKDLPPLAPLLPEVDAIDDV